MLLLSVISLILRRKDCIFFQYLSRASRRIMTRQMEQLTSLACSFEFTNDYIYTTVRCARQTISVEYYLWIIMSCTVVY